MNINILCKKNVCSSKNRVFPDYVTQMFVFLGHRHGGIAVNQSQGYLVIYYYPRFEFSLWKLALYRIYIHKYICTRLAIKMSVFVTW